MTSMFNAFLQGKELLEEIPELRVLDINYTPAVIADTTFEPGFMNGSILTDRKYSGAKVGITVEIHEYDPVVRHDVCLRLQQWAINGGVLVTSDRAGQRLNVVCTNIPAIASALRWTDKVTVEFMAYGNPFWEEDAPQTFTLTGNENFTVNGCVSSARVSATVKSGNNTNSGTAITQLSIRTGDTTMSLEGINVAKNRLILIGYDANGFLTIKTDNGVDLMKYRKGADELLLKCGKRSTCKVSSNTAVTCTLEVRGLWL